MKAPAAPAREPFPKGTHTAICYAVVDLGTQQTTYLGDPKMVRQIKIQWEVPALRFTGKDKDTDQEYDKPKVIGQTYTFSVGEKAKLNHLLTSWGFEDLPNLDFHELLGRNCLLNVVHKTSKTSGNIYSVVSTAMSIPIGANDLEPENPLMYYSVEEDGLNIPDGVYDWMKKIIMDSVEYKARQRSLHRDPDASPIGEDTTDFDPENDIPF